VLSPSDSGDIGAGHYLTMIVKKIAIKNIKIMMFPLLQLVLNNG
jgi:hypothetical protein